MAPKMVKAKKSPVMTKGALAEALATACGMKKKDAVKALDGLNKNATAEVNKSGVLIWSSGGSRRGKCLRPSLARGKAMAARPWLAEPHVPGRV
mmetsp:Transcript_104921/g.313468  ORF Transcript_104921/g.313468 Transcript_104921/m.313468 type:complete len:94 (-) Transcript_104921:137-418(-)